MKKFLTLFAVVSLATFGLAACGGSDDSSSDSSTDTSTAADTGGDSGGDTVSISAVADGSLAFEESELSAPAGANTFEFDNPSSTPHDFCIESDGEEVGCSDTVSGDTATLDEDLDAGEYTFYCSIPGHREGGMEGTLTVD